jgi:hypothetical protein
MATNISDKIIVKSIPTDEIGTLPPFVKTLYESLPKDFINNLFLGVTKYVLIIFLIIYLIIALLTIKQISLMTQTIKTHTNKMIFLLGYIHLFAVLVCLLYTLFVI